MTSIMEYFVLSFSLMVATLMMVPASGQGMAPACMELIQCNRIKFEDGSKSDEEKCRVSAKIVECLERLLPQCDNTDVVEGFKVTKATFDKKNEQCKDKAEKAGASQENGGDNNGENGGGKASSIHPSAVVFFMTSWFTVVFYWLQKSG